MGSMRNGCKILILKPAGTIRLGIPRCRWEDNIKTYLMEKV
jgi:hypothetical protein